MKRIKYILIVTASVALSSCFAVTADPDHITVTWVPQAPAPVVPVKGSK